FPYTHLTPTRVADTPPSPPSLLVSAATSTPVIYTLSLHDALPICHGLSSRVCNLLTAIHERFVKCDKFSAQCLVRSRRALTTGPDRKSTRLNSSHVSISYAVFCLKTKTRHAFVGNRVTEHTIKY